MLHLVILRNFYFKAVLDYEMASMVALSFKKQTFLVTSEGYVCI